MTRFTNGRFWVCLFAAAGAWYLSALLAASLGAFHERVGPPDQMYGMYWSAFFDEYRERVFYLAFVAQSVLLGYVLRFTPPVPPSGIRILALGAVVAIIMMPLAGIGVFGISTAPEWPSLSASIEIRAGYLWCIPGIAVLALSLRLVMLEIRRDAS